jgi:signal transduction histidine kinase
MATTRSLPPFRVGEELKAEVFPWRSLAIKHQMTPQDQWILQKERALAWLRLGFALIAIVVIQLNPSRVARYPALSQFSLGTFVLYSIIVLYLTRRENFAPRRIALTTTCLDLAWVSIIVFSTGGTRTPFFFYYSFPVITASSRWGIKASVAAALVGVALYGATRLTLAAEAMAEPIGIDTFLVRSLYLVVLALIFGVLSEFEKKQNDKLVVLSKTAGEVATLDERRRISQELHDGLLQVLATHLLRLEICRRQLLDSPKELERELQTIEEETRNSMTVIRKFLAGKEVQHFSPGMLLEKVREDLRFLRDSVGLEVTLLTSPDDLCLPTAAEAVVYYVFREGIMNIIRHSHASRADVVLKQSDGLLRGSVKDDGVGFEVASSVNGDRLGLQGMRERLEKAGGTLEIRSSPGSGTKISFSLPLGTERITA